MIYLLKNDSVGCEEKQNVEKYSFIPFFSKHANRVFMCIHKCSMAYELRKCEPRRKKHGDKSTDCNDKCIGKPQLHAISTFVANLTYSLNAGMAELQPGTCL